MRAWKWRCWEGTDVFSASCQLPVPVASCQLHPSDATRTANWKLETGNWKLQPRRSVTEEEDQIDSRALDSPLADAVGRAGRFRRRGRLQPQEVEQLIFQQELGDVALAELLAHLEERAVADLLPQRQAGAQ